jgi:hypothetical protein
VRLSALNLLEDVRLEDNDLTGLCRMVCTLFSIRHRCFILTVTQVWAVKSVACVVLIVVLTSRGVFSIWGIIILQLLLLATY